MPRNGAGTYSLPNPPVANDTTIDPADENTTRNDIVAALTQSLASDGQTVPTANLPMGGFKHSGVADGMARTHYASVGQVQDGALTALTSVAGTDTITATAPVTMAAYATGQLFGFVAAGANTGAVTININAIGAKSITKNGATALAAGDIASGAACLVRYDGTQFQLVGVVNDRLPKTGGTVGALNLTGAINEARATVASHATTADIWTVEGNSINWTGTATTTTFAAAPQAGAKRRLHCAGACSFTHSATLDILGNEDFTAKAGDIVDVEAITTATFRLVPIKDDGTAIASVQIPVRQTVLSGPVDSSGLPAFGGSTGSTTVTAAGTLIATAANGFSINGQVNRVGSIVNPSWTGLATNGKMYRYLDINSDGTCTPGVTSLAPIYQWGGAYSTAAGQFTYNFQESVGKVGNGATATQTYRVFVGEVTVSGGVVTAIIDYALMGRYDSGWTATLPAASTTVSRNSNLGVQPTYAQVIIECTANDNGYIVGDQVVGGYLSGTAATAIAPNIVWASRNAVGFSTGQTNAAYATPQGGGGVVALTLASWKFKLIADRGW